MIFSYVLFALLALHTPLNSESFHFLHKFDFTEAFTREVNLNPSDVSIDIGECDDTILSFLVTWYQGFE